MNDIECYLCGSQKYRQRKGKVRDNADLKILECTSCGLVFLSSFDHIKKGFYENSGMHGEEAVNVQSWIRQTDIDDEQRFQFLQPILPERSLLDFYEAGNYEQFSVELHENSPEEITGAVKEMEAHLEGRYDSNENMGAINRKIKKTSRKDIIFVGMPGLTSHFILCIGRICRSVMNISR